MVYALVVPTFVALCVRSRRKGEEDHEMEFVKLKGCKIPTGVELKCVDSLGAWVENHLLEEGDGGLMVFDDMSQACVEPPSPLTMPPTSGRVVLLSSVLAAFNLSQHSALECTPHIPFPDLIHDTGMQKIMKEESKRSCPSVYGGSSGGYVLQLMTHRAEAVEDILFNEVLPLVRELCRVTGCLPIHALTGRRMAVYQAYVRSKPGMTQELSIDPRGGPPLEGGKILPCLQGLHRLDDDKEERVSLLDFSSAYPTIGATALLEEAPLIAATYRELLDLRAKYQLQAEGEVAAKACKLFTNSIFYGCLSHPSGQYSNPRLAGIITATGRRALLEVAAAFNLLEGVSVLAGHTDGLLVKHFAGEKGSDRLLEVANGCKTVKRMGLQMKLERSFEGPAFLVCDRVAYAGLEAGSAEVFAPGVKGEPVIYSKGLADTITQPGVVKDVFRKHFLRPILTSPRCSIPRVLVLCRKALCDGIRFSANCDLVCHRDHSKCSDGPASHVYPKHKSAGPHFLVPYVCVAPSRGVWPCEYNLRGNVMVPDPCWYQTHFLNKLLDRAVKSIRVDAGKRKKHLTAATGWMDTLTQRNNGLHLLLEGEVGPQHLPPTTTTQAPEAKRQAI